MANSKSVEADTGSAMQQLSSERVLNVGLIGCGEVAQVIHIPTLSHMSQWFRITYLCDVSDGALRHCASKVLNHAPQVTRDPAELCASPEVDVVVIANPDEYHASHAIMALKNHKHVLVEKPLALTKRDIRAILEAERISRGKLMVGYMRRYAAPLEDALKEVGGMEKVLYARVRDIIGPNSLFISQSATFPQRFTDFRAEDVAEKEKNAQEMVHTALQIESGGVPVNSDTVPMWRLLCGLGSHDLSLMREVLGMPDKVVGASLGLPFWNVLFRYPGFTVSYESGLDNNARFDAHVEVYSASKSVRVQYDTPYVKGLPTTMHISENVNGSLKETKFIKSYEDAYTLEFKELYQVVVDGKPVKTTAEDALQDLELFSMIMKAGYLPEDPA
ncbi:1-carboxy-3-chloro-3,4-dihydroxycyclo hexa-1,5-diene dehydrogenase [Penicillium rolfsii]|nr:1-carboxy-3-chloro-3,4-dihydroxycyclo hexa-1,5-diene dehydrogenase [Penicillium rolfsii]